jgi:hypothetical protein
MMEYWDLTTQTWGLIGECVLSLPSDLSGVIKHGWLRNPRTKWRFIKIIAGKTSCIDGAFSSKPCLQEGKQSPK